jgi:hypothetical protein
LNVAPSCPAAAAPVVMNVAATGSAGCTDHEGDPLTYAIVTGASHGTATIDTAGTWTYSPALNFTGSDTFTFKANDSELDSNIATVTLTLTNQPLDARNDGFTIPPLASSTVAVLANDSPGLGETGQPLTITAVTQGAKGLVTTDGATVTYDPRGCATGTDAFSYTVSDGQASATKSAFVTIARPGTNGLSAGPVTDTPSAVLVAGSTIASTTPIRLSWCGVTKSGTSVKAYRLQQSTNGGTTWPSTLASATTTASRTINAAVRTTYRWRVRTTDSAGRVGAYAASASSRIGRYQDSSTAIAYSSGWRSSSTSTASGGAVRFASRAGASAVIMLTNVRQVGFVGPRSSTRGSFRVFVDGVLVATVSERASTAASRRVLYVRSLTSGAGVTHRIELRAVGNGRIDLDAILALS